MIIRKANVNDAQAIMELHEHSVLELCRNDYSPDQLQGWVKASTLEKYQLRLEKHRSYIAELDGKVIGYVRWFPEIKELCSIFVHPEHIRQGLATELMDIAEQDAISQGINELWLDASLTAVPFYQALGWRFVERKTHGPLECVRMTKQL